MKLSLRIITALALFILISCSHQSEKLQTGKRLQFSSQISSNNYFWIDDSDKFIYHFFENNEVEFTKHGDNKKLKGVWKYDSEKGKLTIFF